MLIHVETLFRTAYVGLIVDLGLAFVSVFNQLLLLQLGQVLSGFLTGSQSGFPQAKFLKLFAFLRPFRGGRRHSFTSGLLLHK